MYRYAQINEEGYVIGDSYLSGRVDDINMIRLEEGFDITNKKYINGEWVDYEPKPKPEIFTDEQQAILETAVNVDYLVCLADLGL